MYVSSRILIQCWPLESLFLAAWTFSRPVIFPPIFRADRCLQQVALDGRVCLRFTQHVLLSLQATRRLQLGQVCFQIAILDLFVCSLIS